MFIHSEYSIYKFVWALLCIVLVVMVLLSLATTDEWEDICIVPVDEDVSMAIGCADYQSLLISIGMQPPSDMVRLCRHLEIAFIPLSNMFAR